MLDDTDGTPAAETVLFGLDGKDYEIDLSGKNAHSLRTALDPYLQVATRVPATRTRKSQRPAGVVNGSGTKDQNEAIRDWAKTAGVEVAARGRISASVVEQYQTRNDAKAAVRARAASTPAPSPKSPNGKVTKTRRVSS